MNSSTAHSDPSKTDLDTFWDGERSTLSNWFAQLEYSISSRDPQLYSFAVDFFATLSNGKTVIIT